MPTLIEFRALLDRCLPVKCASGELSHVQGEHSMYVVDDGLMARLRWQPAPREGEAYPRPPIDGSVDFRHSEPKAAPLSVSQIEALFAALAALLALVQRDQPTWFERVHRPSDLIPRDVLAARSLASQEQFYRALAAAHGLEALLATEEERSRRLELQEVDAILREHFPVRGGRHALVLDEAGAFYGDKGFGAVSDEGGSVSASFQLHIFEPPNAAGEMRLSDARMQEVLVLPVKRRADREVLIAYVQGVTDALASYFEAHANDDALSDVMPCDLWDASLLSLERATSREDFADAFRASKDR